MKLLSRLAIGILWAIVLVPINAFAYAVTADRTTIFVGETVTLTLSGTGTDLSLFTVGVTPNFTFFEESSASLAYVGSTTGALPPLMFTEINPDPTLGAPLLLVLASEFDPGCATDPNLCVPVPFSVVDGGILTVNLLGIAPTSPGATTVLFDICVSLDCFPAPAGTAPSIRQSIDITIVQRNGGGNTVPEPATIWLALAALIAGGAVFRNGSKRS